MTTSEAKGASVLAARATSESYEAGRAAYPDSHSCNHVTGSQEYYDWWEGWDDAEQQAMEV